MSRNLTTAAVAVLVAATTGGCRTAADTAATPQAGQAEMTSPMIVHDAEPSVAMLPRQIIYRTSAPSDSLVPVNVAGGHVVMFPAPSDLRGAMPQRLADGWYLDRRGVNMTTRFTTWTYAQYEAMPSAPSPDEILKHLDNSVMVTEIVSLPGAVGSVSVAEADSLIRAGLPGCKVVFKL